MSQIGFVYILVNEYMPDVYKVGCTERSPHERAAELSKGTGVPDPFQVLCYMEVRDFQSVERALHAWLAQFRISDNREFFHHGLHHAVGWMFHHRERLSFCAVPDNELYGESLLVRGEFVTIVNGREPSFYHLPDPWEKKVEDFGLVIEPVVKPDLAAGVNFEGSGL